MRKCCTSVSRKRTCLGTQAIWLSSARVSSLCGMLDYAINVSKDHVYKHEGYVLHVHLIAIEIGVVRRRSASKLDRASNARDYYLHGEIKAESWKKL